MIVVNLERGIRKEYKEGIALFDILEDNRDLVAEKEPVVAASVNGVLASLWDTLDRDARVEFVSLRSPVGMRIYERSLSFLMYCAVSELYPGCDVIIDHAYGRGLYGRLSIKREPREEDIQKIKGKMREIVEKDVPFVRRDVPMRDAIKMFEEAGAGDKVRLFKYLPLKTVSVYRCGRVADYSYLPLVPRSGYLKVFDVRPYPPGFVILLPDPKDPSKVAEFKEMKKLFQTFQEYRRWVRILGVEDVGALNEFVMTGEISDLIKIAESLQEKRIAQIADEICNKMDTVRLVLIAGPSSSGKTTFSKRLEIQLRVNGVKTLTISMDDYFRPREETPRDESGNFDFDNPQAIDIPLFNQHLMKLLQGEEVELPKYNFVRGMRERSGRRVKLESNQVLIIEGIHALNPVMTESVPAHRKFKIYVSALTQLNIDNRNRIPTTDTRLIRRIVRDNLFRGYGAMDTIRQWPIVRRGEENFIFPHQEEADIMFNSALPYELAVLKNLAEPLLKAIPQGYPEKVEANRLLKFLSHFVAVSSFEIPPTSILREFIGGSSFEY